MDSIYTDQTMFIFEMDTSRITVFAAASDATGGFIKKSKECLWPLLLTWFNFNPGMDK